MLVSIWKRCVVVNVYIKKSYGFPAINNTFSHVKLLYYPENDGVHFHLLYSSVSDGYKSTSKHYHEWKLFAFAKLYGGFYGMWYEYFVIGIYCTRFTIFSRSDLIDSIVAGNWHNPKARVIGYTLCNIYVSILCC